MRRPLLLLLLCASAVANCGSNPSQPVPSCTYVLSSTALSMAAQGGTGSVAVSTSSQCAWTARSESNWIVISGGASGTGPGTVAITVSANPDTAPRAGALTVAGQTFAVSQPGQTPCSYAVSPASRSFDATEGIGVIDVTAPADCSWSATGAPWITLVAGQAGSGAGTVKFTFANNMDAARVGSIQVRWPTPSQGQNVWVRQAGCLYAVSPDSIDIAAAGGDRFFDVISSPTDPACGGPLQDACRWSAQSSVSWITVLTPMPRNGDSRVYVRVAANLTGSTRSTTVGVGGRTVLIRQAAV